MRAQLAGTTNFYEDEFRCRCGCGLLILHPGFAERLQLVRSDLGIPMHPTSGCRCLAYNTAIGGHPKSTHICDHPKHQGQLGTLGSDFAAVDGPYRGKLFTTAWKHGFSIGWNAARGFLHLDLRILLGMPQTSFDY